jgi:hypothetical protein
LLFDGLLFSNVNARAAGAAEDQRHRENRERRQTTSPHQVAVSVRRGGGLSLHERGPLHSPEEIDRSQAASFPQ